MYVDEPEVFVQLLHQLLQLLVSQKSPKTDLKSERRPFHQDESSAAEKTSNHSNCAINLKSLLEIWILT